MEETTSAIDISQVLDLITSAQGQVVTVGMAGLVVIFAIKTIKWFRSAT